MLTDLTPWEAMLVTDDPGAKTAREQIQALATPGVWLPEAGEILLPALCKRFHVRAQVINATTGDKRDVHGPTDGAMTPLFTLIQHPNHWTSARRKP